MWGTYVAATGILSQEFHYPCGGTRNLRLKNSGGSSKQVRPIEMGRRHPVPTHFGSWSASSQMKNSRLKQRGDSSCLDTSQAAAHNIGSDRLWRTHGVLTGFPDPELAVFNRQKGRRPLHRRQRIVEFDHNALMAMIMAAGFLKSAKPNRTVALR
jgi:hypothetical protein